MATFVTEGLEYIIYKVQSHLPEVWCIALYDIQSWFEILCDCGYAEAAVFNSVTKLRNLNTRNYNTVECKSRVWATFHMFKVSARQSEMSDGDDIWLDGRSLSTPDQW